MLTSAIIEFGWHTYINYIRTRCFPFNKWAHRHSYGCPPTLTLHSHIVIVLFGDRLSSCPTAQWKTGTQWLHAHSSIHTYIHTRVLTKLHASCSTTNSQFVRFTWPAPEWTLIRCFRLHNRHGLRYSMGLRVATPSNGIKGDKSEKYCSEKCGAAGESVWDIWGWYTCRYIFGLWTQFCVRKRKLSFSNMYMYIWSYKYLYFNNCNTRLRVGSSSLLQKCLTFVVVLQIRDFYWPTEISGCWQRHLI